MLEVGGGGGEECSCSGIGVGEVGEGVGAVVGEVVGL